MSRRLLLEMIENEEDISSIFLSQFNQTLKGLQKDNKLSTFINPSSLKCVRQACFKGLGYEPDKKERSINSIGITSVGSYLHEFTQNVLTQMKDWEYIDVADFVKNNEDLVVLGKTNFETKLESKMYHIHFMVDGVMKNKDKLYLIEIKTMTSQKFYALKNIDEYKVQIISYATLLGLSDVLLIAINRDLLNIKTLSYTVSRGEKLDWMAMMSQILKNIDHKEIPPVPRNIERRTCAYCSFREVCNNFE